MAATVGRVLSFSKNAKLLVSLSRLSAVPAHRYSLEVAKTGEPITHTGQVFDEKDPRRARFIGRQKEVSHYVCYIKTSLMVNKNFAIKLVAEEQVKDIEDRVVSCDGGGGALGHPKVYINLDKDTKVGTCGYCGLQFKQKHHH
ncbi:NADH dehydrogenase [ubiquinone] iron-sulfur protein 6, mitochondrial Complex I-13kD-A [Channa argus]|uniref:NADH dehydrogenase [ubiquinone] iron-sulfur protein 6, mitochondrial n=1 Tax=Channa argus TaxID=215402 RepID=A0A6G1QYH9_CHAAH|nr:NADH dehydrogenase [ubiquinone] iron-sulfur protein 6, mitochondrial Complex I-13kD-A [Channa argus]